MNSKRIKVLILLTIIWLIAAISLFNNWINNREEKGDIVTAFATGNYINTNGVVSVYANYGSKYMTDDEKKLLVVNLAKIVGIEGIDVNNEININREEDKDGLGATIITSYLCNGQNSLTDIRLVTIETKGATNEMLFEQYILMEISIDNSIESTVYYERKLREGFEELGIAADISLKLKGSVKGALSNSKKNEISEDIIDKLHGEIVIGSSSDDMYNVYAYTEDIKDYVVNGRTKSNINIVITYDGKNDISWINVATPILNE